MSQLQSRPSSPDLARNRPSLGDQVWAHADQIRPDSARADQISPEHGPLRPTSARTSTQFCVFWAVVVERGSRRWVAARAGCGGRRQQRIRVRSCRSFSVEHGSGSSTGGAQQVWSANLTKLRFRCQRRDFSQRSRSLRRSDTEPMLRASGGGLLRGGLYRTPTKGLDPRGDSVFFGAEQLKRQARSHAEGFLSNAERLFWGGSSISTRSERFGGPSQQRAPKSPARHPQPIASGPQVFPSWRCAPVAPLVVSIRTL